MVILRYESVPFVVLWHGNRAIPETIHSIVRCIRIAFQNARVCIVRFLNLSNNN